MNKYYGLVSGLPELKLGGAAPDVLGAIREGVSTRDRGFVEELLAGGGSSADNRFLREWRIFDRELKEGLVEGKVTVEGNIVEREKAVDKMRWAKIDELTRFAYFDTDAVLGYVAKLMILRRWAALDPQKGREILKEIIK